MKKTKTTPAKTKAKSVKKASRSRSSEVTEHDFIIILGGGLVVLLLTIFLFLQ